MGTESDTTATSPLRVAVIGSGPSGFYTAEHLFKKCPRPVHVDMFDRLPTPFGLVRGGVAPDHQKIKSVVRGYEKIAAHPDFRFYGNVEIGRDISRDDLRAYYHAIVYAVGARADRRMGIAGEHLPGSHSATDFVGWYNGHPDYRNLSFDLSGSTALVVGNGNVAMDVARILAAPHEYLAKTDIANHALDALKDSKIERIIIAGRRGPAQAAFSTKELREFGQMDQVQVALDASYLDFDDQVTQWVEQNPDRTRTSNLEVMRELADAPAGDEPRTVDLRFLMSPTALNGTTEVESVTIEHNELHVADDGQLRPKGSGRTETIPVDIVFRAIGYQGTPLERIPFDERRGVIPNDQGRITDPSAGARIPGEYVVGWIKRGPQGVIGTNKSDALDTVKALLEDEADGDFAREVPSCEVCETFVAQRCSRTVSFADWQAIDAAEQAAGEAEGRPRVKFSRVEDMLAVAAERRR